MLDSYTSSGYGLWVRAALVVAFTMMWVAPAAAQSALAATQIHPDQVPPDATLILRPAPEARALAVRVAHVLELRSGRTTNVGDAPPAGMLEAVPAGQVAIAGDEVVRVLLVGTGGRTVTARVALSAGGVETDARAVALVVEALQDEVRGPAPLIDATSQEPEAPTSATEPRASREPARFSDLDDRGFRPSPREPDFLHEIQPLLFVRAFTGVSSSSAHPMVGAGLGVGVCSERNCAVVSAEYPISAASDQSSPDEVRYRYLTFASGFYVRPIDLGPFTPGASLAFVTRIGSVEGPSTLDTDLGLRATVEMAWGMADGVDLLAESGLDLALDQARSRSGYAVTYRGDRWTPWLQLALRLSPEAD